MIDYPEEKDTRPFLQRNRLPLILTAIGLVIAGLIAWKISTGGGSSGKRPQNIVTITLPPPPPPPPAPTPPPVEQPKMVEQQQTFIPEDKPIEQPPPDEPPIGTNIKGDGGNDSFGLGNKAGNGRLGGNNGNGSRFGSYAGQVQARIEEALRSNRKTRDANMSVKVRIWPDSTGRVTRAQLAGSSGDPAVDAAIQNEVLNGLQLREPPPPGMPTPILLRLSARRPN